MVASVRAVYPINKEGGTVHAPAKNRLAWDSPPGNNSRKKIFIAHFRNIRGSRDDFVETFPDNGDIDMIKAAMVYKEVGYPYMLTPDHVPTHPDDPHRLQGFAFAYGYIKAVIQALEHMG